MALKHRAREVGRRLRVGGVLGLTATVRLYGDTDKETHDYCRWYDRHLRPRRYRRNRVLEIGIGGYDDPEVGGGSLRVWRDYLPRSVIVGFDIEEKRIDLGSRVRIVQGDQTSEEDLLAAVEALGGPPDIVIDDGSHLAEHARASFDVLFPMLPSGGLYVVEDLLTSYVPEMGGAPEPSPDTAVGMARALVGDVQANDVAFGLKDRWIPPVADAAGVGSVCVYPGIFFVEKR